MNIKLHNLVAFLHVKTGLNYFTMFKRTLLIVFSFFQYLGFAQELVLQSPNNVTSIDTVFTEDTVYISGTVFECSEPTPTFDTPTNTLLTLNEGSNTQDLIYDNMIYSYDINLNLLDDSVFQNLIVCESYFWNGINYTESGTYTFDTTNAFGCDSVVTLDLTILNSISGVDTHTACDSFTWIDGNTYTESNNTATDTLVNALGCDSVVTLDLTILNSSSGTDVQTACDTFTWIDGNTYTASNNTATDTLVNALGCDSVVTLDLTINYSSSGTDVQTACDTFTWIDGNTYTESNNTATDTLVNAMGCDSVVTLDLTILNSTSGTDVQTACDSFTWIDGNTYTASNNTATDTLVNALGCDSVVTLDLTINYSNSN